MTSDEGRTSGYFITLEGIDGSGKSTQVRLLVKYLRQAGYPVRATREPGGTAIGDAIRSIVLVPRKKDLAPLTELVLLYAARAQHLAEVVRPALERGEVVISDRFHDASMAYQGYGRGLGAKPVRTLDRLICGDTVPDLTLVLDLDPSVSLNRAVDRETRERSRESRFEAEGLAFQARARAGYLAAARRDPERVKVIQADRPVEEVQREIRERVEALLRPKSGRGRRNYPR